MGELIKEESKILLTFKNGGKILQRILVEFGDYLTYPISENATAVTICYKPNYCSKCSRAKYIDKLDATDKNWAQWKNIHLFLILKMQWFDKTKPMTFSVSDENFYYFNDGPCCQITKVRGGILRVNFNSNLRYSN